MKNFTLIPLIFLFFSITSFAQSQPDDSDNLFYVVIGAFANPRNAVEFTDKAVKNGFDAKYHLVTQRKLHYVYIVETQEREMAVAQAVNLQNGPLYADTWVYMGLLGDNPTRLKIEKTDLSAEAALQQPSENQPVQIAEAASLADGSKSFIFRLRSVDNGKEVTGDVDIFDADIIKGRKMVSYRSNDVVNVKPVNKSGNLIVVCDIFGYRKVQLPVNFNEPKVDDAVTVEDGNVVVTFDLVRLKKGDKVVMYNVYFFNHAAIMRPESRYEVNALLDYLSEKPTSKIKIHGHANGNDFGKIITMGNSKDHYSLSSENTTGKGSATKLSEERARVIQSYLVKEGIDINRMELKAWGGKMPIYDEDHAMAHANVRVEIEILEE